MILKILLVAGVIAFVYFVLIKKKPAINNSDKDESEKNKKDTLKSSDLVECSTCKIYCEIDDALLSNGKYYCSSECLEKA